ncbi:MAG TPA: enoyl-CoA hydratase/isomerase family protein, partial [Actinomycetota bacterium]|nr:enoyl-CoA hydratase/isomerase family protein [Actinomycetota bacterium]
NRPEARNAVTAAMLAELSSALADAAVDPDVRVVVVDGAGPDFCAGADLGELEAAAGAPRGTTYAEPLEEALTAVADHPLPVIVAVHGAALGAGCQLVAAADLAVAAADARLGIPSGRLGIVIGFANIERLVGLVGPRRAAELLVAGRTASGEEAAAWGLVNEAVPPDRLNGRVLELAAEIAASAPLSVRGSKRGIRVALADGHPGDVEMMAAAAFASDDLKEGIRAFRERRSPHFRGT